MSSIFAKPVLAAVIGCAALSGFAAESTLSPTGTQPLLELPDAVKEAIRREAGEQMVSAIELEAQDGKQVYECTIAQPGFDRTVRLDTTGGLVSSTDWNKRVDEGKNTAHQAWEATKAKSRQAWEATKSAVGGGNTIDIANLPPPVRATIEREAAGNDVRDIKHEMKNGQHFYEAEVKITGQPNHTIKVSEDGSVVERH